MIHETVIDESLNLLLAHFKNHVIVRPPASAAELAELEEMAGPLPRDFTIFYATCNGVRVQLDTRDVDAHICCLHEIENVIGDRTSRAALSGLALVRGDPNGTADWLVLGRGPAYGCVIRWNPWRAGASLMASSFGRFLNGWVAYLTERFDRNAQPRIDRLPPKFDAAYLTPRDPDAVRLRKNVEFMTWLNELSVTVPSGDDFE